MVYKGIDMSRYPICDTDIWVDVILSDIEELLVNRYGKIIVCDVVKCEILYFLSNRYFKRIATRFLEFEKEGRIIVIDCEDINKADKAVLERQLRICDSRFVTGLADMPHEKHKGEIASAIYAVYFRIPFLESNDGIFKGDGTGKRFFPGLVVKDLDDMLKDLLDTWAEQQECRQKIMDNRALMDEGSRIYNEERNGPVTEGQVVELLEKMKGNQLKGSRKQH